MPAIKNSTVLDKVWLEGGNDFQMRVPRPTQENLHATTEAIFGLDQQMYSQFEEQLISLIGRQIINSKEWSNPLSQFKRKMIGDEKHVEELAIDIAKLKGYDPDMTYEWEHDNPKIYTKIHTKNRDEQHIFRVNKQDLKKAFLNENGVYDLVQGYIKSYKTADNLNEYETMKEQMKLFTEKYNLFNVKVPDIATTNTPDSAKAFMTALNVYAEKVKYPTRYYTPFGNTTFTLPNKLMLITTPEVSTALDLNLLAQAFNISFAEAKTRVITIDSLPTDDLGYLIDEDALMYFDCFIGVFSKYNMRNRYTYTTFSHSSIISMSPMSTFITLSTRDTTNIPTVTIAPTTTLPYNVYLEGGVNGTTLDVNGTNYIKGILELSKTPNNSKIPNTYEANSYVVEKITDATDTYLKPITNTFVNSQGILYLQDNIAEGDEVTLNVTSLYDDAYTKRVTYTVGAVETQFPRTTQAEQEAEDK